MGLILLAGGLALSALGLILGIWVGKAWPCDRCDAPRAVPVRGPVRGPRDPSGQSPAADRQVTLVLRRR